MKYKIGDRVRTANYPSNIWNDRSGRVILAESGSVLIEFTDGRLPRSGGFGLEHVISEPVFSEPTPQELADEYRQSWGRARDIRRQLEAMGYVLKINGNLMAKNNHPIENFKFTKTVTITETL